jgi:hypothetical protein
VEKKFYRLDKHEVESDQFLIGRRKLWDYLCTSLRGPNPEKPLKFSHLIDQADEYDVSHLFVLVIEFLNAENFQKFGERIEKFFTLRPSPNEDIFHFSPAFANRRKRLKNWNMSLRGWGYL